MAAQSKKTNPKSAKTPAPESAVTEASTPTVVAPEAGAEAQPRRPEPKGKLGAVIALLRRSEGAQVEELMAATGWQAHSVRGAMSGALKKKLGLTISSEKTEAGRIYRIVTGEAEVAA